MEKRRLAVLAVAGLLVLSSARVPTADIRIETHDLADVAPKRFQAGVDIGVFAVKLLVTWSAERLGN